MSDEKSVRVRLLGENGSRPLRDFVSVGADILGWHLAAALLPRTVYAASSPVTDHHEDNSVIPR
jgi:hypothetical protein